MEEKEKKVNNKKTIMIILILIIIFLILMSFLTIFAVLNSINDKIISGVQIQGIDVSKLSINEAKQKLEDIIENSQEKQIILKYNDFETVINQKELLPKYNLDETLNAAYNIGRKDNIFQNNFNIIKTKLFKQNININITYDENFLNEKINTIATNIPGATEEYSYYIEEEDLVITRGKPGIVVQKQVLYNKIKEEIIKLNTGTEIINIPVEEKDPDKIDVEKIHSEIYKEAADAYITQDPFTVHPNVNGVDFAITLEEAKGLLMEEKEEYIIPLKITIANKTVNDLGEEAFPNTLGTFSTIFDASNRNRTNNISLATKKINGTVILPGETFSYNQTVGKRTIAAGFKEAGAYANGKVIQEVGGGICQVSSTLYNAVLYANLDIVERSSHYFQTSYVDAGRDATVSWGTLDFKFKNNRKYPIKIEASSRSGVSKVSIKGIKEEKEYEVVIQSKITSIIQQNVKYEEDARLDESIEEVIQSGHNGCTSKTYKIVKFNGATISNEVISTDYYHSLDRIIRKGTKSKPVNAKPVEPSSNEKNNEENNNNNNDENKEENNKKPTNTLNTENTEQEPEKGKNEITSNLI